MLNKKILHLFLAVFSIYFVVITFLCQAYHKHQMAQNKVATAIIHETMRDHFKLFLDAPLTIGTIGANYFSLNPDRSKTQAFISELYSVHTDLVGLNIVHPTGEIATVHPIEGNENALGKTTQNLKYLRESFERKEPYFFSAPFELFQGEMGFVFYVPFVSHKKLQGWLAPVSSSKKFLDKFRLSEFLKSYDLIIKDETTGLPYYATALHDEDGPKTHEFSDVIYGRKIIFECWPKAHWSQHTVSWASIWLLTFLFTLFTLWIMRLHWQRALARKQLREISVLLQMTSKEAMEQLVEVHDQVVRKTAIDETGIKFVNNLIEQVNLLQTLTLVDGQSHYEVLDLGRLIENELGVMAEIIQKKNLSIVIHYEDFKDVHIKANRWLIQNSVLGSLLSHMMIYSREGSTIQISLTKGLENVFLKIHATDVRRKEFEDKAVKINRNLDMAQKILQLYQGDLDVEKDAHEGLVMEVRFVV